MILFICLWSFSSRQLAWCHSLLSSAAQPPGECPSSLFLSCPDLKGGLHRLHQRRASAVHTFIGRPFVPLRMRDAQTTPVLPEVSRRISNFDGAAEPPQSGIPCPPVFPNGGPKIYTKFVSECEMPTDHGVFRLRSYQHIAPDKQFDIVVMISGDLKGRMDVPVRVHDQCMTSEALGSKRCDCKDQLDMAMEYVGRNNGAVIYLQQEGRGIGLANKIGEASTHTEREGKQGGSLCRVLCGVIRCAAAYALQDRGMDTVDANRHLGFEDDTRSYESVPFILRDIGVESILLMTNNPRKVRHLTQLGVNIEGIIPLRVRYRHRHRHPSSPRQTHIHLRHVCVCVSGVAQRLQSEVPGDQVSADDARAASGGLGGSPVPDQKGQARHRRGAGPRRGGHPTQQTQQPQVTTRRQRGQAAEQPPRARTRRR